MSLQRLKQKAQDLHGCLHELLCFYFIAINLVLLWNTWLWEQVGFCSCFWDTSLPVELPCPISMVVFAQFYFICCCCVWLLFFRGLVFYKKRQKCRVGRSWKELWEEKNNQIYCMRKNALLVKEENNKLSFLSFICCVLRGISLINSLIKGNIWCGYSAFAYDNYKSLFHQTIYYNSPVKKQYNIKRQFDKHFQWHQIIRFMFAVLYLA